MDDEPYMRRVVRLPDAVDMEWVGEEGVTRVRTYRNGGSRELTEAEFGQAAAPYR